MSLEDSVLAFFTALGNNKVAIAGFRKTLYIAKQQGCTSVKIVGCFFNFTQNSPAPVDHQDGGSESARVVQQVAHTIRDGSKKILLSKKSSKGKASSPSESSVPLSENISSYSSLHEDDELPWTQVAYGHKSKDSTETKSSTHGSSTSSKGIIATSTSNSETKSSTGSSTSSKRVALKNTLLPPRPQTKEKKIKVVLSTSASKSYVDAVSSAAARK